LLAEGRELGMEPLVEVHRHEELDRALAADAKIIGVNNRDLTTFDVGLHASFDLIEHIPENCVAVSESGLRSHDDLRKLRAAGFDAFLVGEQLMMAREPGNALAQLLNRVAQE